MKIIVSGANGQVGQNLVALGPDYDFEIIGLERDHLDITSKASIDNAFSEFLPELLINAAAYTAVDKAEADKDNAFAVNDIGSKLLAEACARARIPLLHISTDYVFDGTLGRPYNEEDPVLPESVYACSKEAGERQIREALNEHIILRTSWVFSKEGACFPKTILRLASERPELKVVEDQIGGPSSAKAIASVLLEIAQIYKREGVSSRNWGTYHFSQEPYVSWYELALEVVALGKASGKVLQECEIKPCPSSFYPTPVRRPNNSRLDCSKLYRNFGIGTSSWLLDLEDLVSAF